MLRLLFTVWHYAGATLTSIFNERADPRIQIEQAIDEARQMHVRLVDQAAAVIGGQRELELKIARATAEARRLDASTAHALRLSAAARAKGDETAVAGFERSAQIFATQLATTEGSVADLRELHEKAALMAAAARRAVEQNSFQLQRQLGERIRLLTDIAAAEMQERMVDALRSMDRLSPAGVVPTMPQVQDRIDSRIAKSAARIDLALSGVESQMVQVERAMVDSRGAERLADIRRREGLAVEEGETT